MKGGMQHEHYEDLEANGEDAGLTV